MTPVSAASRVAPVVKSVLPETKAIKEMASAAYQKADDAGVVIAQAGYGRLADDIGRTVAKAGFHPKIHPKVSAALEEISGQIGTEPSLSRLEQTRRVVQAAAKSIERDERRLARIVVDKIDDFVERMSYRDVSAGNPAAGAAAITEARGLWRTASKAEAIEGLIEKATLKAGQYSGSGFENALRTVFRQFASNPKAIRTFNAEERAAIQKVAKGGPFENVSRFLGKMAPTGIVSGALSGGSGYAMGGYPGAATVMTLGAGARLLATKLTERNARLARDVMKGQSFEQKAAETANSKVRSFYERLLGPARMTSIEYARARNE